MARIGRIRTVSKGIESYTYLINGIAGVGKTTTVCEIGLKKFGQDGFFLATLGAEPEPDHIGNIWNEVYKDIYETSKITGKKTLVKTGWEWLNEDLDSIISERDTEYKDLKMIGMDSIGELFRLCETYVVKEYNDSIKDPSDKVKTINEAYKGFSRGKNRVVDLVTNMIIKLKDANLSLFFIGHTKQKNGVDIITETEYEQITSDVETKYYNCIKDRVNIVMCAYVDRRYKDFKDVKNNFTKETKQIGRIDSEDRVVAFKDDYAVDLKCHLTHMPDKCMLDSDVIIAELEKAIELQANDFGGATTTREENLKAQKEVQASKIDNIKEKEEKLNIIKNSLSKINMDDLKSIMTKYSITDFSNAKDIPINAIDELLSLI